MTCSFLFLTHQRENYVRPALRSMLAQDCPPADILISDDRSSDRTFAILQEEVANYRGPHHVRLRQNTSRLGEANFWQSCTETNGDYVIVFHDDDVFEPDRAARLLATLASTGAAVVSSNARLIDAAGTDYGALLTDTPSGWVTPEEIIAGWGRKYLGATQAYARSVLTAFPPWAATSTWGVVDSLLPFRGTLLGGTYYLDEPLMCFRRHATNMTLEINNEAMSSDARREADVALLVLSRHRMLDDLEAFAPTHGADADRVQQLREQLMEQIAAQLARWSGLRHGLLNAGQRPLWVDRDALLEAGAYRGTLLAPDPGSIVLGRPRQALARALRGLARRIS